MPFTIVSVVVNGLLTDAILQQYMLEMINARKTAEKKEERYDLFSSLLDASDGEDGSAKLTNQELLGKFGEEMCCSVGLRRICDHRQHIHLLAGWCVFCACRDIL